jgi:CBS domain-containing protein
MVPVRWLLDQKGHTVWTIEPIATVYAAISLMAEKNIGALVVIEDDTVRHHCWAPLSASDRA